MRHFFLLGMIILLTSCVASRNYYSQTLESWQGGKASHLMKRWGNPEQVMSGPQNSTILTYKTSSYRQGLTPGTQTAFAGHAMSNASHASPLECSAFFTVNKKGIIVRTQYLGSGCYASESFAKRLSNNS